MIGFVLGTGEGRAILSHVNKYTDEIVVSTATEYGYEIYKEFKAKHFNYRPLNEDEFKDLITKFGIDNSYDYTEMYNNMLNSHNEEGMVAISDKNQTVDGTSLVIENKANEFMQTMNSKFVRKKGEN